jgi:NhaA family Na+:H+ antiporter
MTQIYARPSAIRRVLEAQSSAGIVLMVAAILALIIANSGFGAGYAAMLHTYVGPLSLGHWINDGLMAVFFLLVGLEIKREVLDGQLSTWSRRILPGIAAAGGMIVPALVYLTFSRGPTAVGWAIPAATDIAFALGVIALLGNRVPASLRVFLAALAILTNAAVPVLGLPPGAMLASVTVGTAAGLLIGVFEFSILAVKTGLADMPAHANRLQLLGVALLCGIGFFITLLAFPASPLLQAEAKIGVLGGSFLSGLLGFVVLRKGGGTESPRHQDRVP